MALVIESQLAVNLGVAENMTTRIKTLMAGSVTGLTLLGLTAIPAVAHNHDKAATTTVASNHDRATTSNIASNHNQPATPTEAQMNRMIEQCTSMMGMMQNQMDNGNRSGMMNGQSNQPGQGMMNRTTGQ